MKKGTTEYRNLHRRIQRIKGKAILCEDCRYAGNCDWANISGKYLEDPTDYKSLCKKCHIKFDNNTRTGSKWSVESRAKLSAATKGRVPWNKGKPWSEEMKARLKASQPDKSGPNNPRWRGGRSAGYQLKMRSLTK